VRSDRDDLPGEADALLEPAALPGLLVAAGAEPLPVTPGMSPPALMARRAGQPGFRAGRRAGEREIDISRPVESLDDRAT